jgi:hypothetical protein
MEDTYPVEFMQGNFHGRIQRDLYFISYFMKYILQDCKAILNFECCPALSTFLTRVVYDGESPKIPNTFYHPSRRGHS